MISRRMFLSSTLALLTAACGGGGDSEEQATPHGASYNGTTLMVNGRSYPRQGQPSASFAPGQVIAFPRFGQINAARSALTQLDLTFSEQDGPIIFFTVYVPTAFESQWVTALRDLLPFENATLNELLTTQQ